MKVAFWQIGKTRPDYFAQAEQEYAGRLKRYLPFEVCVIPDIRKAGKLSPQALKEKEAQAVLKLLHEDDFLVLLDERGKAFSSVAFAKWMEARLSGSGRRLLFLVGGAYGFSEALRQRANAMISLSPMTFSHQLVRPVFLEQLYRAMSILRNEPYHNT